jgi:DHA1 family tetracycline resistance protein-like MFS transporter
MGLAAVLGPLVGSTAFGYFVSDAAPVYLPGASFAAGAVLIVAALVLA